MKHKSYAYHEKKHTARVVRHAAKRAKTRQPYQQPKYQHPAFPLSLMPRMPGGGFMELLRREIYAKGRAA